MVGERGRFTATDGRECLDWLMPLSEAHLRFTLNSWIAHYNGGRPHMALGPGVPDPPVSTLVLPVPVRFDYDQVLAR